MNISPLILELAEGWFSKYQAFLANKPAEKTTPSLSTIKLQAPLSHYKDALKKLQKTLRGLSYEEQKLVLLLFSALTHQTPQQNLWNIVRFFHKKTEKQFTFLSTLMKRDHPLYTNYWIIHYGGWPPENQMNEFFTVQEYLSTLSNDTLAMNAIGYGKILQTLLPEKNAAPFSFTLKKRPYTNFSDMLNDIQILFSHLKYYKTLYSETLLPPPLKPWFETPPFSSMIDTIMKNFDFSNRKLYPQFSESMEEFFSLSSAGFIILDPLMRNKRPLWIFYLYLLYLVFIRQETQQSIEHALQMLSILPEEIPMILSFFHPKSPFIEKGLLRIISSDFFEEEDIEAKKTEDSPSLINKNFEINRQEFIKLVNLFAKSNPHIAPQIFYTGFPGEEIQTSSELPSFSDALDFLFENTEETQTPPKENTTSVLTVEKKETLYEVIKPNINLSKIILDEDVKQELLNAVDMTKTMKVLKKWGVKPSLSHKEASSVKILLYGVSGTGKTITAQALAGEAHAKLFKVDAANLVSSFVGESTKNVKKVFEEYYDYVKNSKENVFFFINEADQLLSSRGMIHQAADKEYNQMQNLLLEEIENFQGVFIATTNLIELFDVAWNRRFNIKIRFDIPKYETRLKLWQVHISEKMPLAPDVDLSKLAEYELAGGSIANVVYNAARKAATRTGNDQIITQKDFLDAIDKEIKSVLGLSTKKVGFNK
ncbi:ATP-binding protein [Thermospira aquatica]|uniref:ATP-binding protein n=1 Tax=Thermospira aquatica TaxID=2828656 RepID=A0AAX3BB89_9SPIR|nr:ATP-binding protein [Thermospira aquatica]URA09294.1 ATP-binding protein [Thermospira aquatica]